MNESNLICPFMNIAPRMMEFVASPKANSDENQSVTDPSLHDEQKRHDEKSSGFSMGTLRP